MLNCKMFGLILKKAHTQQNQKHYEWIDSIKIHGSQYSTGEYM